MTRRVPVALVAVGILLTVVTLAVGGLAGEVPSCATGSVLELELAFSESKAVELVGACDADGLDVLQDALRIDTIAFVPLYAVSVSFWCLLAARRLAWSTPRREQLVRAAVPAIIVAAAFDSIENRQLATVIDAAGASDAIALASAASVVKWLLVLFAVPTSVVAMVRCVRGGRTGDPA